MVDYQDHRVDSGMKLKVSENDVLEDHQDDDVMKFGGEDEDEDEDGSVQIPKNDDDSNNDNIAKRICHVCNKGFGSGKALGGHMRIHVQAFKKQLLSTQKAKKSKPLVHRILQREGEEEEEEVELETYNNDHSLPTCSICGKNFPSMKSLFGHMRCHPERAWRGIQPPNELHRKTTFATTATVPGWSVTAKRGRKPNAKVVTISVPNDEEQLHEAVHHLMLLANGDSIESGLTGGSGGDNIKHDIPEELEITNSNSLTSKAENEEFPDHRVSDQSKIIGKRRKKKKMKLKFLDSVHDSGSILHHEKQYPATTPEKYKCSICKKSFATHQALGGHKSTHNKFRMVIQNSDVTNVAATSEEAAASSSKFIHTTGRRILDFDLNELPPDHHEDELSANHEYFSFFPI